MGVNLKVIVFFAVVLVIAAFYFHGTFDRVLQNVGLNYNECGRNGFGATFCGDELTEYRERVQRITEPAR